MDSLNPLFVLRNYLAQEAMRRGDWADAAETLEREAGEHRDNAFLRYRLACCHAQAGESVRAIANPKREAKVSPTNAPTIYTSPWAKLMRRSTPYTIVYPTAMSA